MGKFNTPPVSPRESEDMDNADDDQIPDGVEVVEINDDEDDEEVADSDCEIVEEYDIPEEDEEDENGEDGGTDDENGAAAFDVPDDSILKFEGHTGIRASWSMFETTER